MLEMVLSHEAECARRIRLLLSGELDDGGGEE